MSFWSNLGECRGGDTEKEAPTRTVRCVIDKESGERGSGDALSQRFRTTLTAKTDAARLKNHMQWKRQKEAEHARRKEAERLEEERKKEENMQQEKEKRRKEREREQKLKEWREQKAREKKEREREEMVFKALEQEIKGVTQTLDKEKLIHEWIRLKNKQKQIEAEKKAELTRKEEETRALRQRLAEISYRQWKERSKTRRMFLPKNGYQIFGPKPVPVVKEDWNHDFMSEDTHDRGISARTTKSTLSMSTLRAPVVSRTALSEMKNRSPSSCHLKVLDPDGDGYGDGYGDGWKDELALDTVRRHEPRVTHPKILPIKNKPEVYLNECEKPKKTDDNLQRYLMSTNLSQVSSKLLIDLNAKLSACNVNGRPKPTKKTRNLTETEICRRSRSHDKPLRADPKPNRSSSSTVAEQKKHRKPRKKPEESVEKREADTRTRKPKKAQKADPMLSESPYCAKRAVRGKTKAKTKKED